MSCDLNITREQLARFIPRRDTDTIRKFEELFNCVKDISAGDTGEVDVSTALSQAQKALKLLSQQQGEIDAAETFERYNQNLRTYDKALTIVSDFLTTVTYTVGTGTITKTLNYDGQDRLSTVVLSGSIPSGIATTKTFVYDSNDWPVTITYS